MSLSAWPHRGQSMRREEGFQWLEPFTAQMSGATLEHAGDYWPSWYLELNVWYISGGDGGKVGNWGILLSHPQTQEMWLLVLHRTPEYVFTVGP